MIEQRQVIARATRRSRAPTNGGTQSDEGPKTPKTGRPRSVRLLAPLAADLAEWRLASERSGADDLVFPAAGGELWRDHDWRNWRRRVFDPLAADVGVSGLRPYDLRHSFCSCFLQALHRTRTDDPFLTMERRAWNA